MFKSFLTLCEVIETQKTLDYEKDIITYLDACSITYYKYSIRHKSKHRIHNRTKRQKNVKVKSYKKKDGTRVKSHKRSSPKRK